MKRYIFGNRLGEGYFETRGGALEYLRHQLLGECRGRYRHSNTINEVDSIIFALAGKLVAELIVCGVQDPTAKDMELWDVTRKVYIVSEIRIFRDRTVRAAKVGLTKYQFGREVPDKIYARILEKVGGIGEVFKQNQRRANAGVVPIAVQMGVPEA